MFMKKSLLKVGLFLSSVLLAGSVSAAYQCEGENVLTGIQFGIGENYLAPGHGEPSTNYTATWDNNVYTLNLGVATQGEWQAQFRLTLDEKTLVNGKQYFVSFDIETNVALPRVYMKAMRFGQDNNFIDIPSQPIAQCH